MKILPIILGMIIGTIVAAGLGFILPEARNSPEFVGIFAVIGFIMGGLLGFIVAMLRRSPEERAVAANPIMGIQAANAGRGGVGFGILIIIIAVVWFVVGLAAGRIFFYPPIMVIFGIISIVKGLLGKND